MADIILNKVINEVLPSSLVIDWLISSNSMNKTDFKEISECNVSQIDFITFFLNFLHEEVPRVEEIPQKLDTPKQIEKEQNVPENSHPNKEKGLFSTIEDKSTEVEFNSPITPLVPFNKYDNYSSPISPLYQNTNSNFNTAKSNNKERVSLCLGDFLVSTKNSGKKKKKNAESNNKIETCRRINPTNVPSNAVNVFQKAENSFNFQDAIDEEVTNSISSTEHRNILEQERQKILTRKESFSVKLNRPNNITKSDIRPLIGNAIFQKNLDNVIAIYREVLNHNLVINITTEIYFLITLLIGNQKNSNSFNCSSNNYDEDVHAEILNTNNFSTEVSESTTLYNSQIFESIDNVVYFAVKSLESQFHIIKLYDKATIRLLINNERIKFFSLDFFNKLHAIAEEKIEKLCWDFTSSAVASGGNVCFNIDTDNVENFPDPLSFHAFRKQRDIFYEILRIWETKHLTSGWNFQMALTGKVENLFGFHSGSMNLIHLSKLFKEQLLNSCNKELNKEMGLSENNVPFLSSISIDVDKLSRLTNRLVTKPSSNGINSLPTFSGYQDFFKDFLIVSSYYPFMKHLADCILNSIIELNNNKILTDEEFVKQGDETDLNTQKLYVSSIKQLRILAKFLGFIESLPYKSEIPKSSKILEIQIKIRKQIQPNLDLKSLLVDAIKNRTILLIIPWLTKYMAMLDYVALRLPYYQSIFPMLFEIYQNPNKFVETDYNIAIIKFSLGWLFELPHFPEVEYLNFCSINSPVPNQRTNIKKTCISVDDISIINQSILYLCCPYLEEIKKVLSESPSSKMFAKYITPVSASKENNEENIKKKIEQQLEESFLNGQSSSLRKTVDFVSERVASAIVKYICYDLVPKAKLEALEEWQNKLVCSNSFADPGEGKIETSILSFQLAQDHLKKLEHLCEEEFQKISTQNIKSSLDGLLSLDTLEGTKNICFCITQKICKVRLKEWMQSHINLKLFTKDLKNFKKKCTFELPPNGRNCPHNEETLNGFYVLDNLREGCYKIVEDNSGVSHEFIEKLLDETFKSLTQRRDINDTIISMVCGTLLDFCILLIARCSILIKNVKLISIWAIEPNKPKSSTFKMLFSQKNIKILRDAARKDEAWDLYAQFISSLLSEKFIDYDDLESQCTGFYSKNWDEEVLISFSHFLKRLVHHQDPNCRNKFAFLLHFLSDYCRDL